MENAAQHGDLTARTNELRTREPIFVSPEVGWWVGV